VTTQTHERRHKLCPSAPLWFGHPSHLIRRMEGGGDDERRRCSCSRASTSYSKSAVPPGGFPSRQQPPFRAGRPRITRTTPLVVRPSSAPASPARRANKGEKQNQKRRQLFPTVSLPRPGRVHAPPRHAMPCHAMQCQSMLRCHTRGAQKKGIPGWASWLLTASADIIGGRLIWPTTRVIFVIYSNSRPLSLSRRTHTHTHTSTG
jgi:hypothetical protein